MSAAEDTATVTNLEASLRMAKRAAAVERRRAEQEIAAHVLAQAAEWRERPGAAPVATILEGLAETIKRGWYRPGGTR